jgi:hypothetical protein
VLWVCRWNFLEEKGHSEDINNKGSGAFNCKYEKVSQEPKISGNKKDSPEGRIGLCLPIGAAGTRFLLDVAGLKMDLTLKSWSQISNPLSLWKGVQY